MSDAAGTNPGTGLYDGVHLPVLARQMVASARRSLRPVSVVCFELEGPDGGAPNADALDAAAVIVLRTLRESDASFRTGDHRITALLEDTGEDGALWAARRVRSALLVATGGGRSTASAGIACYPEHALDAEDLVARAEAALATARRAGPDAVEVAGASGS